MSKNQVQVRIDEKLKTEATKILSNIGLDLSSAVRLFLNRIVIEQGLPFEMKINKINKHNLSKNENEFAFSSEQNTGSFDPVAFMDKYILENNITG